MLNSVLGMIVFIFLHYFIFLAVLEMSALYVSDTCALISVTRPSGTPRQRRPRAQEHSRPALASAGAAAPYHSGQHRKRAPARCGAPSIWTEKTASTPNIYKYIK